jgi:hypothetical protein
MAKRLGFGSYQYELVEGWPKIEIRGAVAQEQNRPRGMTCLFWGGGRR